MAKSFFRKKKGGAEIFLPVQSPQNLARVPYKFWSVLRRNQDRKDIGMATNLAFPMCGLMGVIGRGVGLWEEGEGLAPSITKFLCSPASQVPYSSSKSCQTGHSIYVFGHRHGKRSAA